MMTLLHPLETSLLQDTIERADWHVHAELSGDGDRTGLNRMLKLAVAAFCPDVVLPVLLDEANYVPDLHVTAPLPPRRNDEVERRALRENEDALFPSSICSFARRRCARSLQPIVRFRQRTFARRSAMRVCQPGPVAFHRATTSAGKRRDINLRGFGDTGLPPLLILARVNISSVSSGNSSYSCAFMTCESTRAKSDFKERRDALLFAFIGFPHAKYMASCIARCVPDDYHSAIQVPETDHASFSIILTGVLNIQSHSGEYLWGIFEVQPTISLGLVPFRWIEGDRHRVIVYTTTS
jgi:hypothetical protein